MWDSSLETVQRGSASDVGFSVELAFSAPALETEPCLSEAALFCVEAHGPAADASFCGRTDEDAAHQRRALVEREVAAPQSPAICIC